MARLFSDESSQFMTNTFGSAPITAYPFTMLIWVYRDEISYLTTAFQIAVSADIVRRARLICDAGNTVTAIQQGSTGENGATSSGTVAINTWAAVGGRFVSSTDRSVFLNGARNDSAVAVGTTHSYDRLAIGAQETVLDTTWSQFFSGRLAEAAIYNVELTNAEHAAYAAGTSPLRIRPSALKFYCPMIGASPEPDYTAGQTPGFLVGTSVANHPPVERFMPYADGPPYIIPAAAGPTRRSLALLGVS